jgi:MFS family permease
MSNVTFSSLLRTNARFRNLWAGQVVSELGNWFNLIAELGLARKLSGSAWAASLMVAAHLLPFCLIGPFAGAIADRFSRKQMMIWADVARAVIALGFLFVTSPDRLWIAFVCAAALSSVTAVFEGAKNAAMPNIAEGAELLPANALMHATKFLQMTIGALLGGWASERFGYQTAFGLNAVSFVVSAYFIARIPATALGGSMGEAGRSVAELGRDLAEAFRFIRASPVVLGIVALNFGWALGGGMNQVIMDRFGGIIFAEPGRSGDAGVALLYAAAGIGLVLGMAIARRVGLWIGDRDRLAAFMGWAVFASGFIAAASGLMPNIWLMCLLLVANRLILSAEYAVQETVLMTSLPDHLRGKVFTIDRSIELATMAVSALIAGALFETIPARAVPAIGGILMATPGILWLVAVAHGRLQVSRAALGG